MIQVSFCVVSSEVSLSLNGLFSWLKRPDPPPNVLAKITFLHQTLEFTVLCLSSCSFTNTKPSSPFSSRGQMHLNAPTPTSPRPDGRLRSYPRHLRRQPFARLLRSIRARRYQVCSKDIQKHADAEWIHVEYSH